jgi:hypothetical protein
MDDKAGRVAAESDAGCLEQALPDPIRNSLKSDSNLLSEMAIVGRAVGEFA